MLNRKPSKVACDALSIWNAAVDAVRPERVVRKSIEVSGNQISIDDQEFELADESRIYVVGAGKAVSGMVSGLLDALKESKWFDRVSGWVNAVGEPNSGHVLQSIVIHPSRSIGSNFPTSAAVVGTRRIIEIVSQAKPHDLVVCLISGGGSSLLVDPIASVTLADKIDVTRTLSLAGASIHELNCVRRVLSNIKGGGLLRHCRSNQLVSLIISDVLDDDLATIASGPTCATCSPDWEQAMQVMIDRLSPAHSLVRKMSAWRTSAVSSAVKANTPRHFANLILANNVTAVDAAGVKAVELGYRYHLQCYRRSEGDAVVVGDRMVGGLMNLVSQNAVDCNIEGGEPTVDLSMLGAVQLGRGGRNQHIVLSAALRLLYLPGTISREFDFCLLSGGTDGEDGSTPVAGAWIDRQSMSWIGAHEEQIRDAKRRFDSHSIFRELGTMIDCGMTGTNVCDVRVVLVRKKD